MSRMLPLLTWLAFPIYVWQGLGVRRRTERMLPAQGRSFIALKDRNRRYRCLCLGIRQLRRSELATQKTVSLRSWLY